jgi:hypothetical protein
MGKRLAWRVCESDLSDAAHWTNPDTTPPPLGISEAVHISRGQLSRYFPNVEQWDLEDVELHSFAEGTKWFYVVSWRARGTRGDDLGIPVLMSGHPVELRSE